MDSRYIRSQALTLTKSHEERIGPLSDIAASVKLYGYDDPCVAFSDDPAKVGLTVLFFVTVILKK
jgi:hypothetical protein